jgi:hypothetical protein
VGRRTRIFLLGKKKEKRAVFSRRQRRDPAAEAARETPAAAAARPPRRRDGYDAREEDGESSTHTSFRGRCGQILESACWSSELDPNFVENVCDAVFLKR